MKHYNWPIDNHWQKYVLFILINYNYDVPIKFEIKSKK